MRKIIFIFATVLMALMTATSTQAANEAYAVYDSSSKTLTFKYGTKQTTGTVYSLNQESETPGWIEAVEVRKEIVKVVFDASFANARPTNTRQWFDQCQKLEEIIGIENLNTSEVTNMYAMFNDCSALKSLDLSSFNTSKVEIMNYMFYGTGLTALDLSNFDTSNVSTMFAMFAGSVHLTSLDLTSFNTSNVTDMTIMFDCCSKLKTILVGKGWNIGNVTESVDMFGGCESLEGCEGTQWDEENPTDTTYARGDCGDEPGYLWLMEAYAYLSQEGEEFYVTEEELEMLPLNSLVFRYDPHKRGMVKDGITVFDVLDADKPSWYDYAKKNEIKCVAFDYSFSNYRPTTTCKWFDGFEGLSEIKGIENLNTSEVTDMSFMFYGKSELKTLNLSNFDTGNVTTMEYMFAWSHLKTIYVGDGWNIDKVTTSNYMFDNCYMLEGCEGTKWDEENPTDKTYARGDCGDDEPGYLWLMEAYAYLSQEEGEEFYVTEEELEMLPLNSLVFRYDKRGMVKDGITVFDVLDADKPSWYDYAQKNEIKCVAFDYYFSNYRPTTTRNWFAGFKGLREIKGIENLNTSEVTDMSWMFAYCYDLENLDLSSFNTSEVTNMESMFMNCSILKTLDLSSFNTSKVTNMESMFRDCISLKTLDLSSFNTSEVTNMARLFQMSSSLETIYVGDDWKTDKVKDSTYMFFKCGSLVGGMGTVYDSSHTDKTYARIDGNGGPGYFTAPVGGIVTGIEAVANLAKESSAPLYNLQGQRVSQPVKGQIYIQGGKKIKM